MTYDKIPSDASYTSVANISLAYSLHYKRIVIIVNKYIKFLFHSYMFIQQYLFSYFSVASTFLLIQLEKECKMPKINERR